MPARPPPPPAARLAAFATTVLGICVLALATPSPAPATIPLPGAPDWSSDDSTFSTGGAFVDIDGDHDLDLVVGNGNDMEQERNTVYYNTTGSSLETVASWRSDDAGFHGHLAVGDVDGDGKPDVAVSRYGQPWPYIPQRDRLYYNLGTALETTPSWISAELDNSFSLSFGDVDGDGDLDLAVACGESYTFREQRVKIYLNNAGTLSSNADWMSDLEGYAYDVAWGDVDGDGDLDLAVANERGPNHVYYNLGTALETTPSWTSGDDNHTLQADWGDVDGDGDLDLAVADNNQLASRESRARVYLNLGGALEALPSWNSATPRDYQSCVRWGDVDFDGDPDLAAGGWWEPVEVYENLGGTLAATASWSWQPSDPGSLVCEQLVWGDVDQLGVLPGHDLYDGDGLRRLFYTRRWPLYSLDQVIVAGIPLTPDEYCFDPECGWISLATPPPAGHSSLEIQYQYSGSLDLLVTNWHEAASNHLFLNTQGVPTEVAGPAGPAAGPTRTSLRASPNPLTGPTTLSFELTSPGEVEIALYSIEGRRVRLLARDAYPAGVHRVRWDATDEGGRRVAPGIYLARLSAAGKTGIAKLVVVP